MDNTNKVGEDFFVKNMPTYHLEKTNRVSCTQFLSLFNVNGTSSKPKLDAFYRIFESRVLKDREQKRVFVTKDTPVYAAFDIKCDEDIRRCASADQCRVIGSFLDLVGKHT